MPLELRSSHSTRAVYVVLTNRRDGLILLVEGVEGGEGVLVEGGEQRLAADEMMRGSLPLSLHPMLHQLNGGSASIICSLIRTARINITIHELGVSYLVFVVKTIGLFVLTALAEIVGCYLPYLWLRKDGSPWLLVPAAASLAVFAWLLTLHPTAAGRVYAAYGGVYIAVAVLWLWWVEGVTPTRWDWLGAGVTVIGMAIIIFAPQPPGR